MTLRDQCENYIDYCNTIEGVNNANEYIYIVIAMLI